ncbi:MULTISPECIES: prepilin-type N-terminal cleavage/methylation domain-containing protein [Paraliobacillus]|uniref:type IV pilus modification PilV family protein n=2 Tax=Bacillaceae TaxID=186817 RepID=UPI001300ADB6|nr:MULTISPECIES: type II secretion system protein [Paraliobacillus]
MMTKSFSQMNNQNGMTLVEIIVSIAILSIIIVTFLTFFIQSTKVNNVSKDITDSSYVAQSEMEEIYHLSDTMSYVDTITYLSNTYHVNSSDSNYEYILTKQMEDTNIYNISITFTTNDDVKDVVVKVYNDANKLEAQLETKLLWES